LHISPHANGDRGDMGRYDTEECLHRGLGIHVATRGRKVATQRAIRPAQRYTVYGAQQAQVKG